MFSSRPHGTSTQGLWKDPAKGNLRHTKDEEGSPNYSDSEKADLIAQKGLALNASNQGISADGAVKRRPIPENARTGPRCRDNPRQPPQNNPQPPRKASIESVGGIEGIYDLLKKWDRSPRKRSFIDLAQDF